MYIPSLLMCSKISIPTPRKVNGNSKREKGFKSPSYFLKKWNLQGWWGGSVKKPKQNKDLI